MANDEVDGIYTRKKGLRRTYRYTVKWNEEEQGVGWYAKVYFEKELKGRLNGILLNNLIPPEHMVVSLVEASIENLVQMVE